MLLTVAALREGAAENVNGRDKLLPQFSQMPTLKYSYRVCSHICQYEDKRSVLPCVARHHRSTLEA